MSLDFKPGDTVYAEFTTQVFSTGVATNADTTPTGTVNRNGTDDGAVTVTVTNLDTGRYNAVFTIPATYVPGDVLNLSVAATVSSVTGKAVIGSWKLGYGLIAKGTAGGGGSATITLQTALGADGLGQGCLIALVAGTGAGQAAVITGYVNSTKVVTVDRNWVTAPDSTTVYAILYADLPAVDASQRVAANVTAIKGTPSAGAAGYIGVDWAAIANQGTAVDLAATSIFAQALPVTVGAWFDSNTSVTSNVVLSDNLFPDVTVTGGVAVAAAGVLIQVAWIQSGDNLYFRLYDGNAAIWNGASFEGYTSADYTTYAQTLSELHTSSYYTALFPTIPPADYVVVVCRASGVPAEGDKVLGSYRVQWDGEEVRLLPILGAGGTVPADVQTWLAATPLPLTAEFGPGAINGLVQVELAHQTFILGADVQEWRGGSPNALVGGNVPTIVESYATGMSPTEQVLDLNNGVETGFTARQTLKLLLAASAGKVSGATELPPAGTSTITIKAPDGVTTRITAVTDALGNRLSVTYNLV